MAVNKVVYGTTVLVDLTSDTVTADTLAEGVTAHDSSGALIVGTMAAQSLSDFLDKAHPVGSYYETSEATFDPNVSFVGTWIKDTAGLVTVGVDTDIPMFETGGLTGGEIEHTLTVDEIPAHKHEQIFSNSATKIQATNGYGRSPLSNNMSSVGNASAITKTGGGLSHNNMPPFITVHRWHRTA